MPRKAGGTIQSKAKAKGGAAIMTSNDGGPLLSSSINSGIATGAVPVRGSVPTRGVKRRRTSNNVNSNTGNDMYNSGTIIASNPFDDDHHVPMPNHTISNVTNSNSKMMIIDPNYQHQPMHHHHHGPPQIPMHHHHQPPPPHQQMIHHQQQQMFAPQHPHASPMHQNNHPSQHHYQMHQQPMAPLRPHHMNSPPGHMPGGPPPYQVHHSDQHLDSMQMQQQPPYNSSAFCGNCQREVFQGEPNIICKAGCKSLFHLSCSGLTQLACDLLMKESLAEWACDRCTSGSGRVPYIKYKI